MYVSLFLKQLQVEGYAVFVIEGKLPKCKADDFVDDFMDEDEELKRAIELSLKDSQDKEVIEIQDDDEDDLQKALEMSLNRKLTDDEILNIALKESMKQQVKKEENKPETKIETKEEVKPVEVVKKKEYLKNYTDYINNTKESTKIQMRFPDGKKEVVQINKDAPLSALYALFHSKLSSQDLQKDFALTYVNEKIPNDDSVTISSKGISNASILLIFE